MHIEIADSNRFGTLTTERLEAFEEEIGSTLPEPYRTHLLEHNGGYVEGAREIYELHHVHGLNNGPDWAQLRDSKSLYGGLVPADFLAIADDPGGNLICIVLTGPNRGEVRFWDHERAGDPNESSTELAPDFGAFLQGLAIKVAISRGQVDVVRKTVIEVGLDTPVYAGKTALDLAFERGSEAVIRTLMSAGEKIRDDALIEAVRSASFEMVNDLLTRNVNVNYAVPETGFTALMLSASRDVTPITKLLLDNGADPSLRNRWGKTAADLAHSPEMLVLLRAH